MESGATPSRRFICIHGHFYQPPRENPWLETVETEDSAAPYHDWNERVTAECYAPNGAARIVNPENRIIRILNNYGRISFNFGPTLLSWLEVNAGRVYRMILDADANSRKRFGGHGSAMAQVYNHIIMPLASTRDRVTEIRWGIADFERRFERKPEGMWLPETAADTESLELLAAEGIKFVVLAPHQCARVRPLNADSRAQLTLDRAARTEDEASGEGWPEANPWMKTPNASVDTTRSYLVKLKNDRSIAVFFYDGPRSQAIAFNGLLNDGNALVDRLMSGFAKDSDRAQLVHVATDGETYGHHHKLGEMALAWALKRIEGEDQAQLTNYGQFLEMFPPEYEAEIVENTSWSCAHGVERWRSNCGCNNGHGGWNQEWRAPLRASFDGLRDGAAPLIQQRAAALFKDLDAARDAYIDVILDRDRTEDFLAVHASHDLTEDERIAALQLMELERNLLLMYTSCGWFFDEISGIEGMQVLSYAGRALHLAEKLLGKAGAALEQQFLTVIGEAHSNLPAQGTGADIYQRRVRPGRVNLEQVAAHYAISSVFTNYGRQTALYCFGVRRFEQHAATSGRARLVTGRAEIRSNLTGEHADHEFAVLHFGDQNITASVKRCAADLSTDEQAALKAFVAETEKAMAHADLPAVIRAFDHTFPGPVFSIQSLFRDEQRRIVDFILQGTISEVEAALSSIYENQASLLRFLSRAGLPRPDALTMAATFALNAGLRRALESEPIDALHVRTYLELARDDEVSLQAAQLGYLADQKMKQVMIDVQSEATEGTEQLSTLENALLVALTLNALPFDLNLCQAQNIWYDVWKHKPQPSVPDPEAWVRQFHALGQLMRISVDDLVVDE